MDNIVAFKPKANVKVWDTWGMVNLYQDHISVHYDMLLHFVEKYDNV